MKHLAVIFAIFLTGCSVVTPVKRNFPEVPKNLTEQCQELQQIAGDKVAITDLLKVIVNNYTLYYQCSNKVDGWKEWYDEQKKLFDSVK